MTRNPYKIPQTHCSIHPSPSAPAIVDLERLWIRLFQRALWIVYSRPLWFKLIPWKHPQGVFSSTEPGQAAETPEQLFSHRRSFISSFLGQIKDFSKQMPDTCPALMVDHCPSVPLSCALHRLFQQNTRVTCRGQHSAGSWWRLFALHCALNADQTAAITSHSQSRRWCGTPSTLAWNRRGNVEVTHRTWASGLTQVVL